jgi:type VI secretion system secreted protein VgrG
MSEDRATLVQTPLAPGTLTFTQLSGEEAINRCFSYSVGLASTDFAVDPLKMLGTRVSVRVEAEAAERWFDGMVSGFRLVRMDEAVAEYEAELRPWLWFLSQTVDCRVFQRKSVPEIIEEIFAKYPDANYDLRLQVVFAPREYCVQYNESDLDFVQRLMEHEGILYFFEYADGAHTLVLVDAVTALQPAEGYETVPFHSEPDASRRDREYLNQWIPCSTVRPGTFTHTDYDFEKPGADLTTQSAEPFGHDQSGSECYSNPGVYTELDRGETLAAIRREQLQAGHVRVTASGTVRGLAAGRAFQLEGFPREDQNVAHFVVSARYSLVDPGYRSGVGRTEEDYRVTIEAAPSALPFRPPQATPRPVMRGPQTATVVGPAGEEIFTDEYARVKVQFHWDRLGGRDENSSCFVRVSQSWAGAGWGFIQIPRIGQEVVIDFIEGDPDRPIITGRVYNAAEMPPYGLPGNATQSGWKSNSSPGGGGYNELMFEDKAGAELVNFQAQKDHALLVKNDRTKLVKHDQSDRIDNNAKHSVGVNLDEDVGNNKTTKVGVDRRVEVGNDDTETIGQHRSLTVKGDETIAVDGNSSEEIGMLHSQTVGMAQTILVKAGRSDKVGLAESRVVGASQTITVGLKRDVRVGSHQAHYVQSNDSTEVKGNQSFKIHQNHATEIGGNQSVKLKGNQDWSNEGGRLVKVGKGQTHDVAEDVWVKAGKSMMLEAADSIVLKCGSAAISMKKDGTITIEGKDVTVQGSGKIVVKASGEVTIKGSKINQN